MHRQDDDAVSLPPDVLSDVSLPSDPGEDSDDPGPPPDLTPETDSESEDDSNPGLPPPTDHPCNCGRACHEKFTSEKLAHLRNEFTSVPFKARQLMQFDKVRLQLVSSEGELKQGNRVEWTLPLDGVECQVCAPVWRFARHMGPQRLSSLRQMVEAGHTVQPAPLPRMPPSATTPSQWMAADVWFLSLYKVDVCELEWVDRLATLAG